MKTENHRIARAFWSTGLFVSLVIFAPAAEAGVYLETTFLPGYSQSNKGVGSLGGNFGGGSLSSESGFSYDLRSTVGYVFRGVLLGFSYNFAQAPLSRDASDDATSLDQSTTGSSMGASLGYFVGNLRLIGTYLFLGTKKRSDKQAEEDGDVVANYTLENEGGTGYQVTLGYTFEISKALKIGPSLVYSSLRYSTQSLRNEVDSDANYTDREFSNDAIESDLQPMITLALEF